MPGVPDSRRFERLADLFERARVLDTAGARSLLDAEAPPADLRAEIEALLERHVHDGVLDDAPTPFEDDAETRALPTSIGGYEIVECIGRGGMGTVYRAEQRDPHRTVAVKVMRAGLGSAELLRRFGLETEMLARLQHPGIAQIFEAGTDSIDGVARPFFAMEFVEGLPLDKYVARHAPSRQQLLELFASICDAVHHAHQKGVIHRDLKPANILVTHEGIAKVLDFGVARATDADVNATMRTVAGELVGTLSYMSPEQVEGAIEQLDTRSDVYALGVILYELLTGRLPYDLGASIATSARMIIESDPAPPASVDRALRGDLTTIALTALAKRPDDRYASASDLAADLRRLLHHQPIAARPATAAYQLVKFARRHRGFVAGLVAAIVILICGVVAVAWQAARIQAESQTRRNVADFLGEMLTSLDPARTAGEPLLVREMLDDAAARLESRFESAPEVRANLDRTVGSTFHNLGEYEQAESHLRRALQDYEEIYGSDDDRTLATLAVLGYTIKEQGRLEEAEQLLREAYDRTRDVDTPGVFDLRNNLAIVVDALGRNDEAVALLETSIEMAHARHGARGLETLRAEGNLAKMHLDARRFDEALPLFERNLTIYRELLSDDHPRTISAMSNLGAVYGALGRLQESVALNREALERSRRVLGPLHLRTLRRGHNVIRNALHSGDFATSRQEAQSLLDACVAQLGPGHPETIGALELVVVATAFGFSMDDAETIALEWNERIEAEYGETHRLTGRLAFLLMNLYDSWEKRDLQEHWRIRFEQTGYTPRPLGWVDRAGEDPTQGGS